MRLKKLKTYIDNYFISGFSEKFVMVKTENDKQ